MGFSNTSYVAINRALSLKSNKVRTIQIHRMLLLIFIELLLDGIFFSDSNTSYVAINHRQSRQAGLRN